ncbi:MAG: asparaginase [Gemmatimonadota bacterium]|nr:asparaginase [Gemmatimonadota bacterium]
MTPPRSPARPPRARPASKLAVAGLAVAVTVLTAFPEGRALKAQEPDRPRVVVITTGGTIASRPAGSLAGDSLVAAVPAVLDHADVTVEEIYRIGSSQMTPEHWLTLARRVNDLLESDPDLRGIVITHGTDTLEETAFFLNLTVRDPRPVVLVGAMRSATAISADGPANLVNAVRVAVDPEASGHGVLVVLNEDIAAARDVWKTHNQRVDTFRSPELGFLGYADPDTVAFHRKALRPHTTESPFDVRGIDELPRVAIVTDYTGAEASRVARVAGREVDGIVVATFAGGRVSPGTRRGILDAVERRVPVVLASRVPGGRIVGDPAAPLGALLAPDLPPHKARILLMLALSRTDDARELQRLLDTF